MRASADLDDARRVARTSLPMHSDMYDPPVSGDLESVGEALVELRKGQAVGPPGFGRLATAETADPKVLMQHRLDTPDGRDL